jgi:hypothetical protein
MYRGHDVRLRCAPPDATKASRLLLLRQNKLLLKQTIFYGDFFPFSQFYEYSEYKSRQRCNLVAFIT